MFSLSLLTAFTLDAQCDVKQTMARIAATYEGIIDYRISVTVRVAGEPETRRHFEIAASKPKRFRMVTGDLLMLDDGEQVWGYDKRRKRYTRDPVTEPIGISNEIRTVREAYFNRFEHIDRLGVTSASCTRKGDTLVIRLGDDKRWKETLTVDAVRFLVIESVFEGSSKSRIKWQYRQTSGDLDPAFFRFTPPAGADRTNALEIR